MFQVSGFIVPGWIIAKDIFLALFIECRELTFGARSGCFAVLLFCY